MAIKGKILGYEEYKNLCNNLIKTNNKSDFQKLHRKALLIIRHSGIQSNHS